MEAIKRFDFFVLKVGETVSILVSYTHGCIGFVTKVCITISPEEFDFAPFLGIHLLFITLVLVGIFEVLIISIFGPLALKILLITSFILMKLFVVFFTQ